jgi:hypothetical protein
MSSLILIQPLADKTVVFRNCTFVKNSANPYGIFHILLSPRASATFEYNIFMNNVALQAAVFFIPTQYHEMLSIRSNQLINNEAKLYGSSIATTAVQMEWANNNDSSPVELLSGDTLPPFAVTLVDLFSSVIVPRDIRLDFFFVNLTLTSHRLPIPLSALIQSESQKGMLQGERLIEFARAQVVGIPGRYELLIAPALNYDRETFYLNRTVIIQPCASPKVNFQNDADPFPRCITRNFTLY